MQKSILIVLTILLTGFSAIFGQSKVGKKEVKSAITKFVKGGDQGDVKLLEKVLHSNYRVIINDTKTHVVEIMDKALYIGLIRDGKIGGSKRDIKIVSVDIVNNTATAKVVLESPKLKFTSKFSLVKTATGNWQVISDMPFLEFK